MKTDIQSYNDLQSAADKNICDLLAATIDANLPEAESKIWHAHPVWFLDGNPIVGYSKLKSGVRLLFWSGQSFEETGLENEGSFKAKQAIGKAKFTGEENIAQLKVSFFGPFYSGYNVVALDPEYKYALVAGESLDYLWILSRETTIPDDVKESYLKIAQSIGYDTSDLVWVSHDRKK
jgi:hypothetical protein